MPDSNSYPVTLCMLTRNEADRVTASLEAARDRVERILVLDAESDDGTRELAAAAGAEVEVRPWRGFVDARRHLLSRATSEWVLMIDADEIIEPGLWAELRDRGFPDCREDGFQLRRRTVYAGTKLRRVYQPDWKTTLARRSCAYLEDRAVHESLRVKGELGRLRTEILHHSYRSAEDQYARIEAYARLGAIDLAAQGKRPGIVNLWLRPAWRWFNEVFLLGGILDGRLGLVMAARSAYGIHLRYRYLRDLETVPPSARIDGDAA